MRTVAALYERRLLQSPGMRRSADRHHGTLLHADAVEARYIGRVCIRNLNHTAGAGDGLQVLQKTGGSRLVVTSTV